MLRPWSTPARDSSTSRPAALAGGPATAEHVAVAFLAGYRAAPPAPRTAPSCGTFFDWCARWQLDPLAARRAHLDAYARDLAERRNLVPSTVARRLVLDAGV